jgi:hypothetical protein
MKKNEIIISKATVSYGISNKIDIDMSYYVVSKESKLKRKKRILTDTLDVVEVDDKQKPNKLSVVLEEKNNYQFVIDLDAFGDDTNAIEKIKKFFAEHPQFTDVLEKTNADVKFIYTITKDVVNKIQASTKEINKALNLLYSLTEDEKKVVAISFGINPYELTEEDIDAELGGFPTGLFVSSEKHREEFINNYKTMFDQLMINVKVAIQNNILTDSDGVYEYGNKLLGKSDKEVYLTLKENKDIENAIVRQLKEQQVYFEVSKIVDTVEEVSTTKKSSEKKVVIPS